MMAHRDKEDASQQCASQSRLDNLLQTWLACLVPLQQGGYVERQLCDGAKSGVHHGTNGKVTLGRDASNTQGGGDIRIKQEWHLAKQTFNTSVF